MPADLLLALWLGVSAPDPQPVTRRQLTRDTVIDGIACAPTGRASAEIHANGVLAECPVPRDTVIAGQRLPAGTWIRLTDRRVLDGAWLPADTELQGLRCRGTGFRGWAVRFHDSGRLALCYLAHDTVIDDIPCHGAWFWRELTGSTYVSMHESGRLKSCRLARAITLEGVRYRKGARIERPAGEATS